MMDEHIFGSGRLTPELLRSATFEEVDGRYRAEEVRTFLERAASALDVLMSEDASLALRAEFSRNAEIAQQVLDAGQTASAQLRQQAGQDARRMIEETRDATTRLREAVELELAESRDQVVSVRTGLIGDLRDLYDRIGASLYRFERAVDDDRAELAGDPAPAPEPELETEAVQQELPASVSSGAPEPPSGVTLPEGAKPPAWQQLAPTESQIAEGLSAEAWMPDPFLVVEDEPLAPGEPLVDLSGPGEAPHLAPPDPTAGESWLQGAPPETPMAENLAPDAPDPDSPTLLHDNALAEALIAGSPFAEADESHAGAVPEVAREPVPASGPHFPSETVVAEAWMPEAAAPAPAAAPEAVSPETDASADAVAVRQLILNSLSEGHPREAVEAYLRDHMGLLEPSVLVDAALNAQPPA